MLRLQTESMSAIPTLTKMLEGLGVCDEIARADACKMEHDVSDESFEKIKEHLKAKGEI